MCSAVKDLTTIKNATYDTKSRVLGVDIWYPRTGDDEPKTIEIGLCDVRAADSIRVTYDFDRDGWVIEQASAFEWPADDVECDEGWAEVAFIKAWAREDRPEGDEG